MLFTHTSRALPVLTALLFMLVLTGCPKSNVSINETDTDVLSGEEVETSQEMEDIQGGG